MKNKVWYGLGVLLLAGFVLMAGPFPQPLTEAKVRQSYAAATKAPTEAEVNAFRFLQKNMRNKQGIIPYLVKDDGPENYSVSESMGQAMEYIALIGDAALFKEYAAATDTYFRDSSGYYYWKIDVKSKKGETSSALVDDLRIAKAYFIAREKKLGNYEATLQRLAQEIYRFDVDEQGFPCDYYDGASQKKANLVSLFYLDVETMAKLSQVDKKWQLPLEQANRILQNIPENQHGFYPQSFQIDTRQYLWPSSINMVENLYTALDVQQSGKSTAALVNFLKQQIKQGKIYNHYHADATVADPNESTAVYALAARLLFLNNEQAAAEKCYQRMLDFQIEEKQKAAGGFGDPETGLVYAFDQLEALLMLRTVDVKDDSQ